jgi:hypothetical protein
MSEAKIPAYGDDLAYIHHTGFGALPATRDLAFYTCFMRLKSTPVL